MKVLLCADMHNETDSLAVLSELSREVEFVICAGDMSLWGAGLKRTLEIMNSWGKRVFVIHGNHEDEEDTRFVCSKLDNLVFFHKDVIEFKGLTIIGFGGGGFSFRDKGFENFVKDLNVKDFSRTILVTHGPPFETCLDEVQKGVYVGCDSYKHFILKKKPLVAVSGHIHETGGVVCNLNDIVLINPGPEGVIIEL